MLRSIEGIIIGETNYGETSKIINIITKDGIIGVLAKGAKTLKSPLRSYTQKFTFGNFQIYYKEDKLSNLKSVDVINELENIKKDIILISYLAYISDLAHQIMKQSVNEDLYKLFIQSILKINNGFDSMIICNIFEVKALDYLGVGISLNNCAKCGTQKEIITFDPDAGGFICKSCYTNENIYDEKTMKMLRMYYLVDIDSITELKISNETKYNINKFINIYYDRYTGLYLKSKKFLEEMCQER